MVSILARTGRCERASIDEVYLDLTDAAETMLAETPPESLEVIDDEALKSHILALKHEVGCGFSPSLFFNLFLLVMNLSSLTISGMGSPLCRTEVT